MSQSVESKTFGALVTFLQQTQRAAESALADEPVSASQFFILQTLEREPGLTQVALANRLGVTAGNVSQLIAKLEAEGFVTRTGAGKALHVSLTRSGQSLVSRLVPTHEAFLRERFSALSRAEGRQLLSLVERLVGR